MSHLSRQLKQINSVTGGYNQGSYPRDRGIRLRKITCENTFFEVKIKNLRHCISHLVQRVKFRLFLHFLLLYIFYAHEITENIINYTVNILQIYNKKSKNRVFILKNQTFFTDFGIFYTFESM